MNKYITSPELARRLGLRPSTISEWRRVGKAGDASALTPAALREIAQEAGVVTSASGSSDRYNAHLVVGAIDRGEPTPSVSRVVRERVLTLLAARRAALAPAEPTEPTAAELEAAGQATLFGGGA